MYMQSSNVIWKSAILRTGSKWTSKVDVIKSGSGNGLTGIGKDRQIDRYGYRQIQGVH